MAAITGVSIAAPKAFPTPSNPSNPTRFIALNRPWKPSTTQLRRISMSAAPDKISEKVEESIKNAEEACSDNPVSGECAAAWDEVEELSAAASHARDKQKDHDPLETYCKDNMETDECRTYDS